MSKTRTSGATVRKAKNGRATAADRKAHFAAVADVLMELSEDIELLGEVLCADAALIGRHVVDLQMVDLIAQKQRSLALLLRADCPVSALSDIGLHDLKVQLETLVASAAQRPAADVAVA